MKKGFKKIFLTALVLVILSVTIINKDEIINIVNDTTTSGATTATAGKAITDENKLRVYFLDVGQANSELIMLPTGVNILIDGGNREDDDLIIDFLKSLGVEKLDIIIATHPHEDHIGGLVEIINKFDVGKVYAPKIAQEFVPTTKVYENFLKAVEHKKVDLISPKVGDVIYEQDDIALTVLSPAKNDYDDMNLYSIVTKLEYKEDSFIFCGDAEKENERDMLEDNYLEPIDVYLVGHHGSATSTSYDFAKEIKPKYSIVSCAKENDYGHPKPKTIETLNKVNTNIMYTYESNTIEFVSDGTDNLQIVEKLPICDGNR